MSYATLRFECEAAVGTITLDRPEVLNAYSVRMRDELHELLGGIAHDDELRVLVVRGAGRAFSAGADLAEFGTATSPFEARRIRFERDVWAALRGLPIPTVAALHGHAIGSGLELALHCSLRIADPSARLWMPEAAVGVLPAAGGTQTLPRTTAMAARMLLLGEPLDAAAAHRAGLIDSLARSGELERATAELTARIAAVPRPTLLRLVRLLRLGDNLGLADAIAAERTQARLCPSPRGER